VRPKEKGGEEKKEEWAAGKVKRRNGATLYK